MSIYTKIPGTLSFIISIIFSISVIFSGSYAMVSLFNNVSSKDLKSYIQIPIDDTGVDTNISETSNSIIDDVLNSKLFSGMKDIFNGFSTNEDYTFEDATTDAGNLIEETIGSTIGSTDAGIEVDNFIQDVENKLNTLLEKTDLDEQLKGYLESEIENIQP